MSGEKLNQYWWPRQNPELTFFKRKDLQVLNGLVGLAGNPLIYELEARAQQALLNDRPLKILVIGPPGSGKSLIASQLVSLFEEEPYRMGNVGFLAYDTMLDRAIHDLRKPRSQFGPPDWDYLTNTVIYHEVLPVKSPLLVAEIPAVGLDNRGQTAIRALAQDNEFDTFVVAVAADLRIQRQADRLRRLALTTPAEDILTVLGQNNIHLTGYKRKLPHADLVGVVIKRAFEKMAPEEIATLINDDITGQGRDIRMGISEAVLRDGRIVGLTIPEGPILKHPSIINIPEAQRDLSEKVLYYSELLSPTSHLSLGLQLTHGQGTIVYNFFRGGRITWPIRYFLDLAVRAEETE